MSIRGFPTFDPYSSFLGSMISPQTAQDGAIPAAHLLGALFRQDGMQNGGASQFSPEMLGPQFMFQMLQYQLGLMFLAQMIASGMGDNRGQNRGQLPGGGWNQGRSINPWNAYNPSTGGPSGPSGPAVDMDVGPMRPGLNGLLDEIAEGEGTDDATAARHGYQSGYDVTLGYGAYVPSHLRGRNLTDMTVGEVKELQRAMLRHPNNNLNSSAVGRYQIVGTTLRGLQEEMGIPDNARFSPELQDRMAQKLLERRGLNSYLSGRISASTFQNRLAREWASIATSQTGRSFYGQGTGTSTAEILAALRGLNGNQGWA